ncbi:putative glycosyltransferase [Porphyridium purpureum]|uniref:Putative glycosyltransferase n=1 Tax=Porphyridium purpureum TaxID=35688 RepID=A0A5J4Z2G2_PORPP|nr:putative glycosyltransferase [Porphyridium purpureum]|eukprot:POR0856..scf295_1
MVASWLVWCTGYVMWRKELVRQRQRHRERGRRRARKAGRERGTMKASGETQTRSGDGAMVAGAGRDIGTGVEGTPSVAAVGAYDTAASVREESAAVPAGEVWKTRTVRVAMLAFESLWTDVVGPVADYVCGVSQLLVAKGHEVHVYVRSEEKKHSSGLAQEQRPPYELINGVHVHRVPCAPFDPSDLFDSCGEVCAQLVYFLGKTEEFMAAHFDVVHALDWMTAHAVINLKLNTTRTCIFHLFSCSRSRNAARSMRTQGELPERIMQLEAEAIQHADRVVCATSALCDELKQAYEFDWEKLRKASLGVDCEQLFDAHALAPKQRRRLRAELLNSSEHGHVVFLFAGSMTDSKGCEELFKSAVSLLLRQNQRTCRFVFYGRGPWRERLRMRAEQLGLLSRFLFFFEPPGQGMKPDAVVASDLKRTEPREPTLMQLYHLCDVVCVPSVCESTHASVLMAWAARKPVLTSDHAAFLQLVQPSVNGIIVEPNEFGISWGLNELLAMDPARRAELGEKGRVVVAFEYSWLRVSEHIMGVYEEVAGPFAYKVQTM